MSRHVISVRDVTSIPDADELEVTFDAASPTSVLSFTGLTCRVPSTAGAVEVRDACRARLDARLARFRTEALASVRAANLERSIAPFPG